MGHRPHDFEVPLNIQRDSRQPCPRCLEVIRLNRVGDVFGFHIAIIAVGELPFQNVCLLLPDMV